MALAQHHIDDIRRFERRQRPAVNALHKIRDSCQRRFERITIPERKETLAQEFL